MNYKTKLRNIRLFAFDYDGVFTNGTVYLMPDGSMARTASARDGFAVQWAVKQGLQLAVITGGREEPVQWRMEGLGVREVHLGASDKLATLQEVADRMGVHLQEVAYMGDDLPDLKALEAVGLSCCPFDAVPEVREVVDWVVPEAGGQGCVRNLLEQAMKLHGLWADPQGHRW
jgi:3-deoxy-D-manno-octulosonate 8-phosphate phosphatase (KDO 8-P phosphatase)